MRIDRRRLINEERFKRLENTLESDTSAYKCFTNNHRYVWGEVKYADIKNEILESPQWNLAGSPFPDIGDSFDIKVDELKKFIYVGIGADNFEWETMCHYADWKKRKTIYY